ncbi:uncharacterized protein [Solanum lycopersicum]|uniref:uncharacterized protein n=1 Tax=Solanum lycopersicum TaxID=4081 RepID=UPI00374902BC
MNPPPLMDENISPALFQIAQAITTQAQAATAQAQPMTSQANREVVPHPNQQVATMASRLRDFAKMNPPTLYGSMVEEDLQEFIDEVYKILLAMGLSTSEKAELATYQLKDVAQAWYVQWRDNRPSRGGSVTWEIFKKAFLDLFFLREMRVAKVVEFISLPQGGMSVHEYSLKLTKLSKYAPSLVSDHRDEMICFVTGVL